MLSRWDMVTAPPDILVTNYSMFNVMLMRDLEDPMFEATREWLDERLQTTSSRSSSTSSTSTVERRAPKWP